jgi:hypothetical protein
LNAHLESLLVSRGPCRVVCATAASRVQRLVRAAGR